MALEKTQQQAAEDGTAASATAVAGAAGSDTAPVEAMAVRRYPVAPGVRLNVRSGPGSNYRLVKVLPYGATVPVNCQMPGETVTGTYGTSNLWDNIANGQFVADAYVQTGSDGYVAPRCG